MQNSRVRALVAVNRRSSGPHCFIRIENRRKNLILNIDRTASFVSGGLGVRHHCRDALSGMADNVVQHVGILRIAPLVVMYRRAVRSARHVLPGQDRMHAGHRERAGFVNRYDARVGMRRPEQLKMQ